MTIPSETTRVSYAGDGATTVFAYTWKIFAEEHLRVVLRDTSGVETVQTLNSDYTVSGVGDANGGNVTMTTAPATGETLVILLDPDFKQEDVDLEANRALPSETLEKGFDLACQRDQKLKELMDRAVLGKETTDLSGVDLTLPDPSAGLLLGWNDTADGITNKASAGELSVSNWAETLLDDASASEARTTLDVYSKAEADSAIATAKADAIDQVSDGLLTTGVDYLSSTQVRVQIGKVEINGVVYEVTAVIDLTPTLTASTWHYVFVEAPASGTTITSSEVSVSTTAPTYDAAKGGWYDAGGTKRCVGVFFANATPAISAFRVSHGFWSFGDAANFLSTTTAPTTLTTVSVGAPSLGRLRVELLGKATDAATGVYLYVANGHSAVGAGGAPADYQHGLTVMYSSTETGIIRTLGRGAALTDASGQVLYAASLATANIQLSLLGFDLPAGLRRTS